MTIWEKERQLAVEEIVQRLEALSRGRTGSNDALIIPLDTLRQVLHERIDQLRHATIARMYDERVHDRE